MSSLESAVDATSKKGQAIIPPPPGRVRARWLRGALCAVFAAALCAWVFTAALAAMPGEAVAGADRYALGAFGLLAAGIAGAMLLLALRENGRLQASLAVAQAAVRRQESDAQRLCAQLENLNATLAVKNRQLLASRGHSEATIRLQEGRDAARVDTSRTMAAARTPFEAIPHDGLSVVGRKAARHL